MIINPDINAKRNGTKILKVSNIFCSVQGEGKYTGVPFIFLRLAGCNFGSKTGVCSFCDTAFQLSKAKDFSLESLYSTLISYKSKSGIKNLLITGGEPSLQVGVLNVIFKWLKTFPDAIVQIETNGTQARFFESLFLAEYTGRKIDICCCPKANDFTKQYVKIPKVTDTVVTFYKYLISADKDSPYHKLPSFALESRVPVYLSPITVYKDNPPLDSPPSIWGDYIDNDKTRANYKYAYELLLEYKHRYHQIDFRISLQTHLFLGVE